MQPDDPSITPVNTATSAAPFRIFLLALIGFAFLLVEITVAKAPAGELMLSRSFDMCAILRKSRKRSFNNSAA
ncbi:hypothetical protein A5686_06170 [Mycobacterium sp. E2479]|nr:hypothetical protein A5686_06170 [Mycobacterium sp. E2479]